MITPGAMHQREQHADSQQQNQRQTAKPSAPRQSRHGVCVGHLASDRPDLKAFSSPAQTALEECPYIDYIYIQKE
jgi:hypothetical protein